MRQRKRASQLDKLAQELQGQGELDRAVEVYIQAAAADPSWAVPLYNLGLLFKYQRNWEESAKYNQRATVVNPKDKAAWWNLGIAATALGRWDLARQAWRGFGIKVPDGDGPIDLPCGPGPVRLNPDGEGEVVWAYRLDPARAALTSIPFPTSGFRYGDLVLNDGAPVGYRKYKGKDLPVFNVIQLLEASPYGTYEARVAMPAGREHLERLAEEADRQKAAAEDWTASVRVICRACSEGRPHKEHDTQEPPADGIHMVGVAARTRKQAEAILSTWADGADGIEVQSLELALEPGTDGERGA